MTVSIYTNLALVVAYVAGGVANLMLDRNDRIAWGLVTIISAIACGLLATAGAQP